MLIRRERADDVAAIAAVYRSAFAPRYAKVPDGVDASTDRGADPPEVGLVSRLRADAGWIPTLALVAIEHDTVVGHLCLTRATVGPFPVLALGPAGVLADHQNAGVGSALIHAALGAADALDEPLVGLLGSPEFYPRFGFVPAARLGITLDEPAWVGHFQVRSLSAYDSQIVGEFHFAEPFYNL